MNKPHRVYPHASSGVHSSVSPIPFWYVEGSKNIEVYADVYDRPDPSFIVNTGRKMFVRGVFVNAYVAMAVGLEDEKAQRTVGIRLSMN